jgi:hypothetical protein
MNERASKSPQVTFDPPPIFWPAKNGGPKPTDDLDFKICHQT